MNMGPGKLNLTFRGLLRRRAATKASKHTALPPLDLARRQCAIHPGEKIGCGHINALPTELLELIFATCVEGEGYVVSPMVLSEVCKHWREVALGYARIWTHIDLFWPNKAKRYFELARAAHVHIYWRAATREMETLGILEQDWAWSSTNRFKGLTLRGDRNRTQIVIWRLQRPDCNLENLATLSVFLEYSSLTADILRLNLEIPRLRTLQLRYVQPQMLSLSRADVITIRQVKLYLKDLLDIMDHAQLLEEVEIFGDIHTTDSAQSRNVHLQRLRSLDIHLNLVSQTHLFSHLSIPETCLISAFVQWTATMGRHWLSVLHPFILARLAAARCVHIRSHVRRLDISLPRSQNPAVCLTLRSWWFASDDAEALAYLLRSGVHTAGHGGRGTTQVDEVIVHDCLCALYRHVWTEAQNLCGTSGAAIVCQTCISQHKRFGHSL